MCLSVCPPSQTTIKWCWQKRVMRAVEIKRSPALRGSARGILKISFGIDRADLLAEGMLSKPMKYLSIGKFLLIYSSFTQE